MCITLGAEYEVPMKVTRRIVDFNRLRETLRSTGFDGKSWQIVTGTIIQLGNKVEGSLEPLGLVLLDERFETHSKAGIRPSHQFNPEFSSDRKPKVGDRVFLIPYLPPTARRPYALKWGLISDLENRRNGFTRTQNVLEYMLCKVREASREWSKSES